MRKPTKKQVKPTKNRVKLDPLTALLETLGEYYSADALTPGITLAILPYKGKPADKKIWYCSMNRYVKRTTGSGIKRLTYFKTQGDSLEDVIQKLANSWYNWVMSPMNVLKKSRLKETLK